MSANIPWLILVVCQGFYHVRTKFPTYGKITVCFPIYIYIYFSDFDKTDDNTVHNTACRPGLVNHSLQECGTDALKNNWEWEVTQVNQDSKSKLYRHCRRSVNEQWQSESLLTGVKATWTAEDRGMRSDKVNHKFIGVKDLYTAEDWGKSIQKVN